MPEPTKPKRQRKKPAPEASATILAVKGFDRNWQCRGFQYEIGKTYTYAGPVVCCAAGGFHACENPLDILNYYPLIGSNFGTVELSGEIARDDSDSKIAAGQITINAELRLPDFIKQAVNWMVQHVAYNASQLAASGDASQLAASGYASKLAASGNASQLAASGDDSIIAASGYQSTVTLGKNGAASLAYYDGKRPRFLTIYEGEDGIEAGVAYTVRDGKAVRAEG